MTPLETMGVMERSPVSLPPTRRFPCREKPRGHPTPLAKTPRSSLFFFGGSEGPPLSLWDGDGAVDWTLTAFLPYPPGLFFCGLKGPREAFSRYDGFPSCRSVAIAPQSFPFFFHGEVPFPSFFIPRETFFSETCSFFCFGRGTGCRCRCSFLF